MSYNEQDYLVNNGLSCWNVSSTFSGMRLQSSASPPNVPYSQSPCWYHLHQGPVNSVPTSAFLRFSVGPRRTAYMEVMINQEMDSYCIQKHLGQCYEERFDCECCQNSDMGYKQHVQISSEGYLEQDYPWCCKCCGDNPVQKQKGDKKLIPNGSFRF